MLGNQANPVDRKRMEKILKEPDIHPKTVQRFKPFLSGLNPSNEISTVLQVWAKNNVINLIYRSVRSHILKHALVHVIKYDGAVSIWRLVYFFQDMGYDSVRTPYKLRNYILKINKKYNLPICFKVNEDNHVFVCLNYV